MAEDDARAYILAFESNKPESKRAAETTASKLQNGNYKLIDVISASREYLQNTDPKIRERATNYLAAIISALPVKFLTRHDIPVLNVFLCSRIQDGGAVEGLSRLQSLDRYTKENAQELAQAIFENFSDMTEKKQAERYQVYMLLNELLSKHRTAMLEMEDKSLLGYTQVVAGEKDPRNLMLIFSMLRVFMIEWDISKHVDAMFDSVYAYFPITFRPPPNDPYGITAQDLKDRLKDCLASTSELAPSVFPNMLDRLDSTSEVVKKDVLQALAACALNYDPPTIAQYSITLWDAVKFEVLQAQEPFLADEALSVIKNVATCLSRKTTPHAAEWKADALLHYLKPINKECLEHLKEPASRQAGASGDILKAASSATTRSFEIVLKSVGPTLFSLQQFSEGINNQRAILAVVNKLFEASAEVYGSSASLSDKNEEGQETLIAEFKDRLLAIYSRALMSTVKEEVSYRLTAVKGLLLLAQQRSLLDENETGLIVQHFNEIVLDEESYGRDELKQKAMQALAEISTFNPRLITDITFPRFIARLPEDETQASEAKDYQSVLEGLAEISVGRDLLETLVRRLLNKLDLLIRTGWQSTYPYTCAVMSTIYYVLDRSAKDSTLSLDGYFDRIVTGFSQKTASAVEGPLTSETVLNLLGRTINLVIRRSSNEHKDQAAQNVYSLFASQSSLPQDNQRFLHSDSTFTLSTWVLAALPRSCKAGTLSEPLVPLLKDIRSRIDMTTSKKSTAEVEQACLSQTALLINKHMSRQQDQAEVDAIFHDTADSMNEMAIEQLSANVSAFQFQVRYLFTLSKALVLRLTPSTNSILTTLVNLLERAPPREARFLALGFRILLAPDEILSKTNEAQIRLLAPQRVFQTLVPIFSQKFRDQSATQEKKEVYLIALSGILGTVSSDIVMPELPTLLPLLLQSLEISDANQNVKVATLETMTVVITKNPDALIESGHIPALARRLLSAGTLPKKQRKEARRNRINAGSKSPDVVMTDADQAATAPSSSPKVRQLALKCLTLLPQHISDQKTPNPLLLLKKEVLNGLANCLDDPRRDVRKEAVDARARWIRGVDDVVDSDEE